MRKRITGYQRLKIAGIPSYSRVRHARLTNYYGQLGFGNSGAALA